MRWISLYLPQLPLDLAYRRWPEAIRVRFDHDLALAVTESRRIRWLNTRAREAGIVVGMMDSTAQARDANLILIARDTLEETRAITEVALWALRFTPYVSLLSDGLLLEVSASLRLFGGHDALVQQLQQGMREFGLTSQLGSAPTATAAWLFSHHADALWADNTTLADMLDRLPVILLIAARPHADTLQAIGCRTLGQLRRLPRTGIVRRFGADLLAEFDRALGLEPESCAWFEAPLAFDARLELPACVENVEGLSSGAVRLLMQMTGWLTARHAAITRLSLMMQHETGSRRRHDATTLTIMLGQPSRDPDHLGLLLREQLARAVLPAPVTELRLQANDIVPLVAPNSELFPGAASQADTLDRLIERLASRLGEAAIGRLGIREDHRPERASVIVPALGGRALSRSKVPPVTFPARPAWLLCEPMPLLIRDNKPFYQSPLRLIAGPERVEAGWWDDALAARDYFIACNDNHLLLWIYQERQSRAQPEAGWFLHGFFG